MRLINRSEELCQTRIIPFAIAVAVTSPASHTCWALNTACLILKATMSPVISQKSGFALAVTTPAWKSLVSYQPVCTVVLSFCRVSIGCSFALVTAEAEPELKAEQDITTFAKRKNNTSEKQL